MADRPRNERLCKRRALSLLACVGLISCSSSSPPSTASHGSAPTTHDATVDVDHTVAAADGESVSLGCADAGSPTVPASDADLAVDGLNFSGVAANGPTAPGSITLSVASRSYVFRKVFLYVAQNAAATTTLEIVAPPDARLYYVTGDTWMTGPSADEVIRGATRRVDVARCPTSLTGYFGGVLTGHGECATLAVTDGESDRHIVGIPVGGGTC